MTTLSVIRPNTKLVKTVVSVVAAVQREDVSPGVGGDVILGVAVDAHLGLAVAVPVADDDVVRRQAEVEGGVAGVDDRLLLVSSMNSPVMPSPAVRKTPSLLTPSLPSQSPTTGWSPAWPNCERLARRRRDAVAVEVEVPDAVVEIADVECGRCRVQSPATPVTPVGLKCRKTWLVAGPKPVVPSLSSDHEPSGPVGAQLLEVERLGDVHGDDLGGVWADAVGGGDGQGKVPGPPVGVPLSTPVFVLKLSRSAGRRSR